MEGRLRRLWEDRPTTFAGEMLFRPHPDSTHEARIFSVIDQSRLRLPYANFPVGGRFVDLAWPEWNFGIDVPSAQFHSTDEQLARDEAKERWLRESAGWKLWRPEVSWLDQSDSQIGCLLPQRVLSEIAANKDYRGPAVSRSEFVL